MRSDGSNIVFRTERLAVRLMQPSDIDFLKELMSDPEVMKTTGFKEPQNLQKIQDCLQKWIAVSSLSLGVWLVVDIQSHAEIPVGWLMLKTIDSEVPEAGYMFAKPAWGQGYATEVLGGLLAHAKVGGIEKILAQVGDANFASVRVLEKSGFVHVGRDGSQLSYEICI